MFSHNNLFSAPPNRGLGNSSGWYTIHVFGIEAEWLDDDRMGALLEGLADHQVSVWSKLVGNALRRYKIAAEFLHADTTSVYFEG